MTNGLRSWHKAQLNWSVHNSNGKTTWHRHDSNLINMTSEPRGAIYPANGSPGPEPSQGAMGTAVKNRGCTAGCHGNLVASNTECPVLRAVVSSVFFFLPLPCIQQTHTVTAARGDILIYKENKSVFSVELTKEVCSREESLVTFEKLHI